MASIYKSKVLLKPNRSLIASLIVVFASLYLKLIPSEFLVLLTVFTLAYFARNASENGGGDVVFGFLVLSFCAVLTSIKLVFLPITLVSLLLIILIRSRTQNEGKFNDEKSQNYYRCLFVVILVWDAIVLFCGGLIGIVATQFNGDGFNFIYSYKYIQNFDHGVIGYYLQSMHLSTAGSSTLFQLFINLAVGPFLLISQKTSATVPIANLEFSISAIFLMFSVLFTLIFSTSIKRKVDASTSFKSSCLQFIPIQILYWSPIVFGLVLANSFFSVLITMFILLSAMNLVSEPVGGISQIIYGVGLLLAMLMSWSLLLPLVLTLVLFSLRPPAQLSKSRKPYGFSLLMLQMLFLGFATSGIIARQQLFTTGGFPKPQLLVVFALVVFLTHFFFSTRDGNFAYIVLAYVVYLSHLIYLFVKNQGLKVFMEDFYNHAWVTRTYYFSKALWIITAVVIIYSLGKLSEKNITFAIVSILVLAIVQSSYTQTLLNRSATGYVNHYQAQILLDHNSKSRFMFFDSGSWQQDINANFAAALVWENYMGNSGTGKHFANTYSPAAGSFGRGEFISDPNSLLCQGVKYLVPNGVIYSKNRNLHHKFKSECGSDLPPQVSIIFLD